jgi:hypothetical protein
MGVGTPADAGEVSTEGAVAGCVGSLQAPNPIAATIVAAMRIKTVRRKNVIIR